MRNALDPITAVQCVRHSTYLARRSHFIAMVFFLPRPSELTYRFSINELDESCLHPQLFLLSLPRKYIRERVRFLAALTIVDPWVRFSNTDRAELFHHVLSPMMSDKNASQEMHSLLAPRILDNMQYADPETIVQFA